MTDEALKKKAKLLSSGVAYGLRGKDGRFEPDRAGKEWLFFDELHDVVYWCPRTGEVATYEGRAFALGELAIGNAATYALEGRLHIHATVGRWIIAGGTGIVVIDWRRAYDMLKDAPRIRVDEAIVPLYVHYMRPPKPEVWVRPEKHRGSNNAVR
ncbi:hypothetical protein HFN46_11825 [Rhizobium leguminosarum]|nr:hypothetical protein [Rhizobium leguminosarum]